MKISEYIAGQPKPVIFIAGLTGILLIGGFDYYTGREIAVSVFYLLPISLVAWYVSRESGIAASLIAAVVWYLADSLGEHQYYLKIIPYWNALVRLSFFLITVFILSRLKGSYEKERVMARNDYLTGVYNSRAFYDLAGVETERARRHNHPLTLAYFDIDNFKSINDRLGHSAGDNLLMMVAGKMKKNVRPYDIVARLGGDEFMILFPETGEGPAQSLLERIVNEVAGVMEENESPVTLSVGAATFVNLADPVPEMIKKADALMYQAKSAGKNRIRHETYDQGRELSE